MNQGCGQKKWEVLKFGGLTFGGFNIWRVCIEFGHIFLTLLSVKHSLGRAAVEAVNAPRTSLRPTPVLANPEPVTLSMPEQQSISAGCYLLVWYCYFMYYHGIVGTLRSRYQIPLDHAAMILVSQYNSRLWMHLVIIFV